MPPFLIQAIFKLSEAAEALFCLDSQGSYTGPLIVVLLFADMMMQIYLSLTNCYL